MTSAISVGRSHESRFLFHCPCGAHIITNKKTVNCANCGKVMEVHLVRTRGRRRTPELPSSTATRHPTPRHHRISIIQPGTGFFAVTLLPALLLLSAFALVGGISNLSASQNGIAFNSGLSPDQIIEQPEPTDCAGLFSGCHYESAVSAITDKRGKEHVIVEWRRVNDYGVGK